MLVDIKVTQSRSQHQVIHCIYTVATSRLSERAKRLFCIISTRRQEHAGWNGELWLARVDRYTSFPLSRFQNVLSERLLRRRFKSSKRRYLCVFSQNVVSRFTFGGQKLINNPEKCLLKPANRKPLVELRVHSAVPGWAHAARRGLVRNRCARYIIETAPLTRQLCVWSNIANSAHFQQR